MDIMTKKAMSNNFAADVKNHVKSLEKEANTLPLFVERNCLQAGIKEGLREGMSIQQMHEYLKMYFTTQEGKESSFVWSLASFKRYVADAKLSRRNSKQNALNSEMERS